MSPRVIPQQLASVAASPAVRRIERLTILITERNAIGQVAREVEVQRIFSDGSERQTTVRAVGYDTTNSRAHPSMVLPTAEARGYIRQAEERKMLEPASAVAQERINLSPDPVSARAAIVQLADTAHAEYPQYAGHWDGEEWQVGIIRRRVSTKAGIALEPGDIVLWRDERDEETRCPIAHSVRNEIKTAVNPSNIKTWTVEGCSP
ncbi:MAG TPA: hypothetical protein VGY76_11965 [Solirubrobacteraceae bacterium]|jgi:hypothetical protein|nr:hypothetical protein [Solirubrobacteraceae bacterium]